MKKTIEIEEPRQQKHLPDHYIDIMLEKYKPAISDYRAFQAILEAGCEDLLNDPKFADLKRFWDDLATEL